MKRGSLRLLFIFLIFAAFAYAQQDEFSVRFHSFGKNATIDLKNYLGESELYLASQTLNVIVEIDQETGIATLTARQGWEGSETIHFRTNESFKKLKDTEEIAKFLPEVPKILYLRKIRDEELARLFEGTIDPSVLDLVKEIKREEIKKISKDLKERTMKIRINDEVDLKMELGYVPTVSMDFSLGPQREPEEIQPEEGLRLKISNTWAVIILAIIAILGLYLYRKYAMISVQEKEEKELEDVIVKDIKQISLHKLLRLQKELDKKDSSERFTRILRMFFSRYFGIEYDFELSHLIRRVKDSDISRHMKNEVTDFLEDVSKVIYSPTEKWTKVYGEGQPSKNELKKFIVRLKRIIRSI